MTAPAPLRVFAPAKINWYLTIEGRRLDGYHDINTVFQTLAWGDELRLRPIDEDACPIRCTDLSIPTGADNLVARAWRRLRDAFPGRVGGVDVELVKRIPAGAGLGGGSSDASAMLAGMRRLFGLPLRRADLEAHAARLGSDCPFFVRGGTVWARGRGEKMTALPNRLPDCPIVVVWPGFTSPTAEAYRRVTPADYQPAADAAPLIDALGNGDLTNLSFHMENAFLKLVTHEDERYILLLDRIGQSSLVAPLLAGSGSAVFALARDRAHAREAAARLRVHYPVAVATRLRRSGVGFLSGPG